MKRTASILIILASLLSLFACTGGKTPEGESSVLRFIGKSGEANFIVITGVKASDVTKNVAQVVASELRKSFGGIFRVSTSAAIKDDKNKYEILIGNTGREESLSLSEGIGENEYRVKVYGKKIVIVGGSDIAISRGVGAFLSAIDYEKGSVPKTLFLTGAASTENALLVGMTNGTSKSIEVYDISGGRMDATSLVWSAKQSHGAGGFKLRNHPTYGEVVVTTSGTHAEMISYETKEKLWSTDNTPENSHSIELLPNGIIAVGGTVGHDIHFYNLNGDDPTKILFEMPHHDAHGLLWDPKNEVLWGAGSNMLFAYRVTLNEDGSVNVIKDEELSVTTPDGNLHDLQPYFGNKDWLLVSTGNMVLVYDKVNKTFSDAFSGVSKAVRKDVKGVGRFLNGDMIYIYPDGLLEKWNSTILNYVQAGEKRISVQINSNMGRFYKCRVWYSDYQ